MKKSIKIFRPEEIRTEPFAVRFQIKEASEAIALKILNRCDAWQQAREVRIPGELLTEALEPFMRKIVAGQSIELYFDGVTEEALISMLEWLAKEMPAIAGISLLGFDEFERNQLSFEDWIAVPARMITRSNGARIKVAKFIIGRRPVTVKQFSDFVENTDYKTDAELQNGSNNTFRSNSYLNAMPKKDRLDTDVGCVSLRDAMAYAQWRGARLPTDDEWLSASVLDWTVYPNQDAAFMRKMDLRTKISNRFLVFAPEEWVASDRGSNSDGQIRRGPVIVLETGWETRNRAHYVPSNTFQDIRSFHICKEIKRSSK